MRIREGVLAQRAALRYTQPMSEDRYGPMEGLTPEEVRRRSSIRYILRRRGRAVKQRANSGAVQKSWAEFGEVNFKPSGSRSGLIGIALFALALFPIYLALKHVPWTQITEGPNPFYNGPASLVAKFLTFGIFLPVIGLTIAALIFICGYSLWNILRDNLKR